MLALLSACATRFRHANSTLPIEIVPTDSSRIVTTRAHETSDRVYVAGSARPDRFGQTHVDVQLIGSDGQVVAEDCHELDAIVHPRTARARSGNQNYVTSFPLNEARQAVKIRVFAHQGEHPSSSS